MPATEYSDLTPDGAEPESFDLSALLGTVRRRLLLIVAIIAVFTGLSTVYVLRQVPLYSSQSLLQLSQPRTALENAREPLLNSAQIDALVSGELRFLSSDNFLLAVIRSEKINEWPEYARLLEKVRVPKILDYNPDGKETPPTMAEGLLLAALRAHLSSAREGATYIVSLTALSEDPVLAARLANRAAKIYKAESVLRGRREARRLKERVALQLLRDREALLQKDARTDDALLKGIRLIESKEHLGFRKRFTEIRIARMRLGDALETVISEARSSVGDVTGIEDLSANAERVQSPSVAAAKHASSAQSRLFEIQDFGAKRKEILSETEKLLNDMKDLLEAKGHSKLYAKIAGALDSAKLATVGYSSLIKRMIDLELRAQLYVSGISTVTYGLVPLAPSLPKKKNTIALSLILGSALGLIVALILDFFSNKIISRRQIVSVENLDDVFFLKIKAGKVSRIFRQTNGTIWHPQKIEFDRFVKTTQDPVEDAGEKNCVVNAFVATETNRNLGLVVRNVAGSVAAKGSSVAVLDLDRDQLISEIWLKKKIRAIIRKFQNPPGPEIQHQRNLFFDLDEYFVKNLDPTFGIPVSPNTLGAIIESIQPAYDYLFVVCPFSYGNAINAVISKHADSVNIVSVYAHSKISHISNFVSWFNEQAQKEQRIVSVVFGAN